MKLRFKSTGNSKGVSPVVGMVLVLAIIAGIMSIIQIKYVPQWDYKKEAQSFNKLVSEVNEIPALLTSKSSSTSLQIDVGVNYPQYPFLVNPLSSYGLVEVVPENVSVSYNIIYGNRVEENYSSSAMIFEPTYLYMPRINLTYEHGAVIEYGQNYAKPIMLSQVAFSKNEINLPVITSKNISIVAKSYVLHFYLVSKGEGKGVYNLTVSFKTLYPELWKQTLSKIYGNSAVISVSGNLVTVKFKKSIMISNPAWYMNIRNTFSKNSTKYVSAILSMPSQVYVNPSGRASITLQVLDRYGNPMDNVSLRVQVNNNTVCQLLNNNTFVSSMVTTTGFNGMSVIYVEGLKQGNTKITVRAELPASKGGTNVSVISVNVTKKAGSGRYTIDIIHANGTLVGHYSYRHCRRCRRRCGCRCVHYDVYAYDVLAKITPRPPEFTPVTIYFLNNSEVVMQDTGFCNSTGYVHFTLTAGVPDHSSSDNPITPQKFIDAEPDRVVVSVGASSAEKSINYI